MDSASRFVLALLACAALAGCAQEPRDAEPEQEFGIDLKPTDTTGIIRGVVVDEGIRPLINVNVTLSVDPVQWATTNQDGAFGFQGLEPGTYFMQVSKLGYFGVQSSADVVAGDAEPRINRVVLKADVRSQPFWQAQVYEGYIQCTTSVLVLCGIANVLTGDEITNDRFAWDQPYADNASHIQAEMVWDTTQALSPELYFELEALNDGCEKTDGEKYEGVRRFLNSTRGVSPIYATINQTEVEAWSIGQKCPVWVSVFSGGIAGTPAGFTVQQRLTMFSHTFHGYMPPSGWRFTADGEPPAPPA